MFRHVIAKHASAIARMYAVIATIFLAAVATGLVSAKAETPCFSLDKVVEAMPQAGGIAVRSDGDLHAFFLRWLKRNNVAAPQADESVAVVIGDAARVMFAEKGCIIGMAQANPVALMAVLDLAMHGDLKGVRE